MMVDELGMDVMSEAECLTRLATCRVGRVAVSIGAVPAVFPVNFGLVEGNIVFRTGSGTKLDAAMRNSVVAFEVDEVDPLYHEGWSVLVVGMADELHDERLLERARDLPLATWAPGPRDHVVCLRPEFISGRRIAHEARDATDGKEAASG